RWQVGDVIKDGPFRQTNNVVKVPDGPGLGVELDPSAMANCSAHFREHGPISHFSHPDKPGRFVRLPLN
ncbi:MAG: chloromuconate cycloisomerase, partial [Pseudomonadota bacterium]